MRWCVEPAHRRRDRDRRMLKTPANLRRDSKRHMAHRGIESSVPYTNLTCRFFVVCNYGLQLKNDTLLRRALFAPGGEHGDGYRVSASCAGLFDHTKAKDFRRNFQIPSSQSVADQQKTTLRNPTALPPIANGRDADPAQFRHLRGPAERFDHRINRSQHGIGIFTFCGIVNTPRLGNSHVL